MFVKLCLVSILLCALQCTVEVESFEIIRNTIKNVADKVRNFVHPKHTHDHNCQHNHENEHVHEDYVRSTTMQIPAIDIRGGIRDDVESIRGSQHVSSGASTPPSSTIYPVDPNAVPDINSRNIIGVSCPDGTRAAGTGCRRIV